MLIMIISDMAHSYLPLEDQSLLRKYSCLLSYYRSADKSLARPTSRYILFNGQNISFDASLVIYINSTNIPPIMIINRIYETQNLLNQFETFNQCVAWQPIGSDMPDGA
jgi:hypothetical protein